MIARGIPAMGVSQMVGEEPVRVPEVQRELAEMDAATGENRNLIAALAHRLESVLQSRDTANKAPGNVATHPPGCQLAGQLREQRERVLENNQCLTALLNFLEL